MTMAYCTYICDKSKVFNQFSVLNKIYCVLLMPKAIEQSEIGSYVNKMLEL